MSTKVLIVGAGLAGTEAANYLGNHGIKVVLLEGKKTSPTPAQKLKLPCELVCTNSLKSLKEESAHGILKHEMNSLGSLVLKAATKWAVPAGDALAVDREKFSSEIESELLKNENIELIYEECVDPEISAKKYGCDEIIVSCGPLPTKNLESWIMKNVGEDDLYFYDAIAPVVDADTLDYEKLYFKDRYKEVSERSDYLNCPMTKEEYYQFIDEVLAAKKVEPHNFEKMKYFEGCLPLETMVERGRETLRFGPLKPVGLELSDGSRPFAVLQLRKENLLGSAYNLVGFQTRMTYTEQLRIFRMLPGFENAQFLHLGSVHRNSFINSKKMLNNDLSFKHKPNIYLAGQIAGVEGYTESASMGLYVAYQVYKKLNEKTFTPFPLESAIGALVNYVMTVEKPAPSSINFGLLPSIKIDKKHPEFKNRKKYKKVLVAKKAREVFDKFIEDENRC